MSEQATIKDLGRLHLKGRNARLLAEWMSIDKLFGEDGEVSYSVVKRNAFGLPVVYCVEYRIRSFCGIAPKDGQGLEKPLTADKFLMEICLPNNYPSADGFPSFRFLTHDASGNEIAHPWHPNIRYYGDYAGRVCLSAAACGTYTDLAWYIGRVRDYLEYNRYHALNVAPFPEDMEVAKWVTCQAEPNKWIDKLKHNELF